MNLVTITQQNMLQLSYIVQNTIELYVLNETY